MIYNRNIPFIFFIITFILLYFFKFIGVNEIDGDIFLFYHFIKNYFSPAMMLFVIFISGDIRKLFRTKIILIGIICIIVSFSSRDLSIINCFVTLLALKFISVRLLSKILLGISLILMLSIILYFSYQYSVGNAIYIWDERYGIRYSFGFSHPNGLSIRIFNLTLLYLLVRKTFTFIELIVFIIVLYIIYNFNYSRTGLYTTLLLLFSVYLHYKVNYFKLSYIRLISKYSFLIFLLLSIFLTLEYSYSYIGLNLDAFNKILSGRISMASNVLLNFSPSLLGQDISGYLIESGIVLDNIYVYLYISIGVLFSGLMAYLYYRLIKILLKNNLYKEVIIINVSIIYGISEKVFTDIYLNLSSLFFIFLLYGWKLNEYKNER